MFDIDSIAASGGEVKPSSVLYSAPKGVAGPAGLVGATGTPGWNMNLNADVEWPGVGFRTLVSNNTTPAVYSSAASLLKE